MQRALEGTVVEAPNGERSEVDRLRDTNRTLMRELHDTLEENADLRKRVATADAPIARLREKLGPFYQLLQAIFGDIDELAPEHAQPQSGQSPVNSKVSAVWDSWKQKMPGVTAEIIDALLTHNDANTQQLTIICKRDRKTIGSAVHRLTKAGLINKNGGRFTLKQL